MQSNVHYNDIDITICHCATVHYDALQCPVWWCSEIQTSQGVHCHMRVQCIAIYSNLGINLCIAVKIKLHMVSRIHYNGANHYTLHCNAFCTVQ